MQQSSQQYKNSKAAFENLKSSGTKADEILDKQTLYQRAKNRKYL